MQKQKEAERKGNERKHEIEEREFLKPLRNKHRAENDAVEECYKNAIVTYQERIMELYHDEVVMCEDTECFDVIPKEEFKLPYSRDWSDWRQPTRAFKCDQCSRMLCAKHSADRDLFDDLDDLSFCHDCYQNTKFRCKLHRDTDKHVVAVKKIANRKTW